MFKFIISIMLVMVGFSGVVHAEKYRSDDVYKLGYDISEGLSETNSKEWAKWGKLHVNFMAEISDASTVIELTNAVVSSPGCVVNLVGKTQKVYRLKYTSTPPNATTIGIALTSFSFKKFDDGTKSTIKQNCQAPKGASYTFGG